MALVLLRVQRSEENSIISEQLLRLSKICPSLNGYRRHQLFRIIVQFILSTDSSQPSTRITERKLSFNVTIQKNQESWILSNFVMIKQHLRKKTVICMTIIHVIMAFISCHPFHHNKSCFSCLNHVSK